MKILVRGTNWIGDAVMTVPALRELRRAFPHAEITLHTRPAAAEVFKDADFIDNFLLIDGRSSKMGTIAKQARDIRRQRFDVGIIMTNSIEAALVQRLAGVPKRFGYATQHRSVFLTDAVPIPEWKAFRHEVYYYLNLIGSVTRSLGIASPETDPLSFPKLDVSEERRSEALLKLDRSGLPIRRPLVALGVGSTNSRAKRWPAVRYAELSARLAAELNANILLVGSEGDKRVADEVKALSGSYLTDLCGKTSVSEAAALLAECDLLIANDMGLAHLAPAVGTKTIVIFGPTDDVTTRPLSDLASVIRYPVECSPCMLRDCPIDHRCMTGVSVETVFEAALGSINK